MNSRVSSVAVGLPMYVAPRNAWRKQVHAAAAAALAGAGITYTVADRLAVDVRLYMTREMLGFHDVDNRLKDVLDALQGRVGGTKSKRGQLRPLIPNDWQIFEAVVKKSEPPKGIVSGGQLTIRHLDDASAV
jgi:Holliday junction resolvase RusA-like endonuclease